ncbi:MAG: helix-turn-helix transcriptional regulator [DPANN group archaeon]|nr:helix-turn-helix transcriptional regulator [DPANN group archaeon]
MRMVNKVRLYRTYYQWTQQELAERVGVRRETILFLEKGKYNPSLYLAWELARTFRVKIEDLFDLIER